MRRLPGRVDPAREIFGLPVDPVPPGAPGGPYPVRVETEERVSELAVEDRLRSQAAYDDLVGRGTIVPLERVGRVNALAQVTPPVVVVQFEVPENYLFRFHRFGFQFSDPILHQLDPQTNLPLLVRIANQPVGGLAELGTLPYAIVPGSIFDPIEFDPIFCLGGSTITVEVTTLAAVTIYCCAMARIGGELILRRSIELGRAM